MELKFKVGDERLENLVKAMSLSGHSSWQYRQRKFAEHLLEYVIKPVIERDFVLEVKDDHFIIQFQDGDRKDDPAKVLNNIELICMLLSKLFKIPMKDNEEFIAKIGTQIESSFLDLLMKQCLIPSVPNEKVDLEGDFVSVIVAIKAFHAALTGMKFLSEEGAKVLLEFADNINKTFVNKRCNSLLNKARNYMRQDLHIATKIGEPIGLGCEDMDDLFKTKTNTNLNIDINVEEEILPLPQGMN